MDYDFDISLLEKQAEHASKKGLQAYSDFCHNHITRVEFMYLKDAGFHDTLKSIAADADKKGV